MTEHQALITQMTGDTQGVDGHFGDLRKNTSLRLAGSRGIPRSDI